LRSHLLRYPVSHQTNRWLAGYPLAADFPDAGTLRQFVQAQPSAQNIEHVLADLWLAYLARLLRQDLSDGAFDALFTPASLEIEQIYATFLAHRSRIIAALDALDARLRRDERWIFINYDELDTLGGVDWDLMALLVRGLLTFWADNMRRWQRLQAKIFLRTDLFANARIFTADFAKLAANRVELTWSDRNLYAMLIKRLANIGADWLAYCQATGLCFDQDARLGWIPHLPTVEAAQPLIEQLTGPFMGRTIKKGRTFTWVLDHLRDGKGQITPRALVNLWGQAAGQELDATRTTGRQLLHPTSLRRALDRVSDDHVRMLESRELPWLADVARQLSGQEVPLARADWEAYLRQGWDDWRNHPQEKRRPPRSTPAEFLDFLVELGVCRKRADGRIDVPDLFLHGLFLRRRGGVER
jgi:hypothetical protein